VRGDPLVGGALVEALRSNGDNGSPSSGARGGPPRARPAPVDCALRELL